MARKPKGALPALLGLILDTGAGSAAAAGPAPLPSLPPRGAWESADDVAAYAAACLAALQLTGWSFGWDRAVRRLGCCHFGKRNITLSRYFTAYYLPVDPAQVHRTLLHELAHALAWVHRHSTGHGRWWQYYCRQLGIPGERATTRCADFTPAHLQHPARPPRYAVVNRETGEVYATYRRRPARSPQQWQHCYIPGRKAETLGMLCVVEL